MVQLTPMHTKTQSPLACFKSRLRVGFLPWQKLFLPGQWKKPVKTVAKTSKNRQNQRHHKLITDFITHILQAAFEPYYNSGTDSEHK